MAPRRPFADGTATGNIVLGMVRVALGRAEGIILFGDTPQAFLTSLAPLFAFPLVGGALVAAGGHPLAGMSDLLATTCALLAPPVLSYEIARHWQRDAHWLRYATAFNWCQWLLPLLGIMLMPLLGMAGSAGLSPRAIGMLMLVGMGGYGLWLHWFLARHALQLSRLRAVLLVIGVNLGTVVLVVGPRLLAL